jgi:hypothetical protein
LVSGYGKSRFLDRIEQTFDWSAFETLLAPIHASARGAPGWSPLVMFKILYETGVPGSESDGVRPRRIKRSPKVEVAPRPADAVEAEEKRFLFTGSWHTSFDNVGPTRQLRRKPWRLSRDRRL